MRKFQSVYKDKMETFNKIQESKVLSEFENVYYVLLENYGIANVAELNEKKQTAFLTEMSEYWSEETGITQLGINFLKDKSSILTESSTIDQRKTYLKNKSMAVLNETIKQTDLKSKLYDVIDNMYKQLNASNVAEVLSPRIIVNIMSESINETLTNFIKNIETELTESVKK
jgi:hypothetical protein